MASVGSRIGSALTKSDNLWTEEILHRPIYVQEPSLQHFGGGYEVGQNFLHPRKPLRPNPQTVGKWEGLGRFEVSGLRSFRPKGSKVYRCSDFGLGFIASMDLAFLGFRV